MRIGIDIGGMSIKFGLVNEKYEIVSQKVIETNSRSQSPEEIIKNMADAVSELLMENGLDQKECRGIGIACPGTVDSESGMVLYSNNIAWEEVALSDRMQAYLQLPIALANDADAAALGEVLNGAAKGKRNALLLTLGTGVGGGVILDKKIFKGPLQGGCEPGHTVIERNGRPCTCGRRGCFEAYASASALMRRAEEIADRRKDSLLYRFKQENGKLDGKLIFDACRQKDTAAEKVVEEYEDYLAEGIANLINIFRPEIVILGGGVSAQKEYLTDAVTERVKSRCFGGKYGEAALITTSKLGNDAGIIGAAYLL